jgi:outer membrane phospholipase A
MKLSIPTGKKLNWFVEWRYYGYGEAYYRYEGFRARLLTAGVRISR